MKQKLAILLVTLFFLMACNNSEAETATVMPLENTAQLEPTTRPALTEPTAVPPTSTITETTESLSAVPAPTLFNTNWQDREIFRAGLVESEQPILDQLPGAPVYHLDLQIEEGNSVVNGRQEILYTNLEDVALAEVYFHLFPNLLGGELTITAVTVNDSSITPSYEAFNNSEMRVPLAEPLQMGEQVVIHIDFVTAVPVESGRNYGVFAYVEDILALAHFYPQVAVYDDAGWNVETAAEGGDVTYADVGFYLVRVTAAKGLVMAAGGVAVEREETADTQTITFAGGPMRDFYLAASSRYQVASQTFGPVTINSYVPAEFSDSATATLGYAISALNSYSSRFAPYPYTELDIVTTPTLALGIEYPGIIANRLSIYAPGEAASGLPNRILLESTTAHEVGHQWFYSLVGNDQLDEPWLDEALTQYATYLYYFDQYGQNGAQGFYESLEGRWSSADNVDIPIGLPVSAYENTYGAIIYGRGPLFFDELAKTMGQDSFDAFLRDYTEQHKWGIATSDSLKQLAEVHCSCDLTALFRDWVYNK
jgi:hypothetical protein